MRVVPGVGGHVSVETVDLRSEHELRVRRAWSGRPGPVLRAAGVVYAAVGDVRHALYELGLLAAWHPAVPVVSIGGLTVGGSGKTPLAAEVARWLQLAGRRPGVVTHGYEDEMQVHRRLLPAELPVVGGRDRERAVELAVERGADTVVVDSGFQRRRLARDFDVLAVTTGELAAARRRLPAGPLRERWSAALRSDALVIVRRTGQPALGEEVRRWMERHLGGVPTAELRLESGSPRPANDSARSRTIDAPVAVSSVMHPDHFLAGLEARDLRPKARFVLPDHAEIGEALAERILDRAGGAGIVCTLKERRKLTRAIGDRAPVWWLPDRLRWERGRESLRRRLLAAVEGTP